MYNKFLLTCNNMVISSVDDLFDLCESILSIHAVNECLTLSVFVRVKQGFSRNDTAYVELIDDVHTKQALQMKDTIYLITYIADCLSDKIEHVYSKSIVGSLIYEKENASYIYAD